MIYTPNKYFRILYNCSSWKNIINFDVSSTWIPVTSNMKLGKNPPNFFLYFDFLLKSEFHFFYSYTNVFYTIPTWALIIFLFPHNLFDLTGIKQRITQSAKSYHKLSYNLSYNFIRFLMSGTKIYPSTVYIFTRTTAVVYKQNKVYITVALRGCIIIVLAFTRHCRSLKPSRAQTFNPSSPLRDRFRHESTFLQPRDW